MRLYDFYLKYNFFIGLVWVSWIYRTKNMMIYDLLNFMDYLGVSRPKHVCKIVVFYRIYIR